MGIGLVKNKLDEYRVILEEERKDWIYSGSCVGLGVNFFPENAAEQKDLVYQYCKDCPVRISCLEYALVCNEFFGVWGATEVQRNAMRRDMKGGSRETILEYISDVITTNPTGPIPAKRGRPPRNAQATAEVKAI